MTLETARNVLFWCTVINFGILAFWGLLLIFAQGLLYRVRGQAFRMSPEQFDTINYAGILFYKVLIIAFNLVPYIAVRLSAGD